MRARDWLSNRCANRSAEEMGRAAGRKAEMTLGSAGLTAGATALGFIPLARLQAHEGSSLTAAAQGAVGQRSWIVS